MKLYKFRLFVICFLISLFWSPWTLPIAASASGMPEEPESVVLSISSPTSTMITHDAKPDVFLYAPDGEVVYMYEKNDEENELVGEAVGAGSIPVPVHFGASLSKGVHHLLAQIPEGGSVDLPPIIIDTGESFDIQDVAEYSSDSRLDSWDFGVPQETEASEGESLWLRNVKFLLQGIEPQYVKKQFIMGQISDRVTHAPVSGAVLLFREENNRLGEIAAQAVANSNGIYKVDTLEAGTYTVEINQKGYAPAFITKNLVLGEAANNANNMELAPIPEVGKIKIELSWNGAPRDLDSHLTGARPDGTAFHVYYGNKNYAYKGIPYVDLNEDVTQAGSFEETVLSTVSQQVYGPYSFYVNNYSKDASLSGSGATVKVFKEDPSGFTPILEKIVVPDTGSNQPYWNVFDLTFDAGVPHFIVKNELTDNEPVYTPDVGVDAGERLSQATLEAGKVENGLITLNLNNDLVSDLLSMNDFESISATVAGATYKLTGVRYAYDFGLPGEINDLKPHIYFDPIHGASGDMVTIHVARSRNSRYLDGQSENLELTFQIP